MSFEFLAGLVLAHGYLVIFLAVALDCAALPIPGELLLLTIGGLAVKGHLDPAWAITVAARSEEHASELQSLAYLVCRLLLEKKKQRETTTARAFTTDTSET